MALKKGLGAKGLGIEALINHTMEDFTQETEPPMEIDIQKIAPNRSQPRKYFAEAALEELAASLKEYGILQPILVKQTEDGFYEIIAGERRWRAAKIAGLRTIPAIVRKWETAKAFEAALVENLQRENLNPLEEAQSYLRLQEEFGYSQEQIANKIGKSRPAVANALRLLQLDARVQNFIWENKLSAGHARALLGLADADAQFALAEQILEDGLSVRQAEQAVKALSQKEEHPQQTPKKQNIDPLWKQVEDELQSIFATKVKINRKKHKGKIEIEYYSDDDLDRLLLLMKKLEE